MKQKHHFQLPDEDAGAIDSQLVLYSSPEDHYCHQVRFVLNLKDLKFSLHSINNLKDLPEELKEINPHYKERPVPVLTDRTLKLYETGIILQYIDDRFPSPLLVPRLAQEKARFCMALWNVNTQLIQLADSILHEKNKFKLDKMRTELRGRLISFSMENLVNDIYANEEAQFSLIDCVLAPMLLRISQLGIQLRPKVAKYQPLHRYMKRIFSMRAFISSCSEEELELLTEFGF